MITGLGHCINMISNNVEELFDLVDAVLKVSFNGNDKIAIALCDLCKSLAFVGSNYNRIIYTMLFREMMRLAVPDKPKENTVQIGGTMFLLLWVDSAMRTLLLNIIHDTLSEILKTSPRSSEVIMYAFKANFPFITEETYLHKHAILNMLRIFSYAPSLRERGFLFLVEWLISEDVEIKIDDTEDKAREDTLEVASISPLDP